MAEFHLILNAEESEVLVTLLENKLREQKVEEHRTRAPTYREHIQHAGSVMQGILERLKKMTQTA